MAMPPDPDTPPSGTLPLLLLFLLLFLSPLAYWWMGHATIWYLPYLLWLGVILAGAWLHRHDDRHGL